MTRDEVDEKVGRSAGRMKYGFKPFAKVYSTKREYREKSDSLRIYHMYQEDPEEWRKIVTDCRVIKFLNDFYDGDEVEIDYESIEELSKESDMEKEEWIRSLNRIVEVNYETRSDSINRVIPYNWVQILSKRFKVNVI